MKKDKLSQSRRAFLFKTIPACAAVCVIQPAIPALALDNSNIKNDGHKFDEEFPRKLSHRQYFETMYGQMAMNTKLMIENFGEENVLEIIKHNTQKRMTRLGETEANRDGDKRNLESYVKKFRGG